METCIVLATARVDLLTNNDKAVSSGVVRVVRGGGSHWQHLYCRVIQPVRRVLSVAATERIPADKHTVCYKHTQSAHNNYVFCCSLQLSFANREASVTQHSRQHSSIYNI